MKTSASRINLWIGEYVWEGNAGKGRDNEQEIEMRNVRMKEAHSDDGGENKNV